MKRAAHILELCCALLFVPVARVARLLGMLGHRLTIVGWWGSETVGDVAILGQLLDECDDVAPTAHVTVVSFDRDVSHATLRDLDRAAVQLLDVGIRSAWALVAARCLIYGGGPLMESPSMPVWALRTRLARLAGARVMVYACGIGPLRTPRTERAVASIIRASTHVVLRDRISLDWTRALEGERDAIVSFDPAFDYVRARTRTTSVRREGQLALALRTPPKSYLGDLDPTVGTDHFLDLVASALNTLGRERRLTLVGCVMHDGTDDSDDHAVYARLRTRLEFPERLQVAPGRHSVADVQRVLEGSQAALTVRFHAMIFALATDTPFVAVDYARPSGKVSAAAAIVNRRDAVLEWDAINEAALTQRLRTVLDPAFRVPSVGLADAHGARLRVLRDATR